MMSQFMNYRILALLTLGVLLTALQSTALTQTVRPGKLSFGWATESIVPNRPVAIGGQYGTRISSQVNDPITVTALAIETSDSEGSVDQCIWVSCDLCAIRKRTVANVRKLVAETLKDLDTSKIIISATHTHTAPALTDANETDLHPYEFLGSWAYRIPSDQTGVMHPLEYLDFLERQIALAVVRSWQAKRPGDAGSALGHASIARNRRVVFFDGTTRMYGDTRDPNFSHLEGTSDDSIDLLCFWRGDVIVGMAITVYCPSQAVEGETYLSADFWYDARQQLRERFSKDLFVLPLTGASGDQSPHVQIDKASVNNMLTKQNLQYRQEIAKRLVRAVVDVVEVAQQNRKPEVHFAHRVEVVPLPVWQVSDERFAESTKIVEAGKDKVDQLAGPGYINWRVNRTMVRRYNLQATEPNYGIEVHAIRLDDLAYCTNPFELFTDYGLRIKCRSPAIHTSVVQLTADCAAYLPTERAVQGGGYSGRIDDGIIGPAGGRKLVDESVRMLKTLWP
jgi:hypothetical protein